jgi:thiosulfate dehydrogenase [quinone] large subunit
MDRTSVLWAVTRISLGWIFLWAFIDKLFGLGFATCKGAEVMCQKAWLAGGSPTTGYLTGASERAFGWLFGALKGLALVDWLFMIGLLGIGLALILGAGMRIAAWTGSAMMVLMWLAALPLANNPIMDDHLIYAMVLFLMAWLNVGNMYGIGKWWKSRPFVQKNRWLE